METEPKIIQTYIATGKAKIIYRHLLQLGDDTTRASEASECAADQGKFWEMRALLYQRQNDLYSTNDLDATLAGLAKGLGLDAGQFGDCMTKHTHLAEVQADYKASQAEGVRSRPVFDINGKRLIGAQSFAQFQQTIDAAR